MPRDVSSLLRQSRRGFTLIELLVVVAVIALLVSIVMPSLKSAREQAKLVVCKSNCHQVACMTSAYQADHRGTVPIVLSWRSNGFYGTPGRASWLSMALRRYDSKASPLPATYDPLAAGIWPTAKREKYEAEVLPEYFICPFEKGDGPRREVHLAGTDMEVTGRHEAIQTWLWEDIRRGDPTSPPAKYSVLTWNMVCGGGPMQMPGCVGGPSSSEALVRHRTWRTPDTRRMRGSFSELTTAFCYQGEHMEFVYDKDGDRGKARRNDPRWNPDSHRFKGRGGSPAIFADSHVEWVPGPNIGWP